MECFTVGAYPLSSMFDKGIYSNNEVRFIFSLSNDAATEILGNIVVVF